MNILLNGQSYPLSNEMSVAELVAQKELNPRQIAIEINRQIVPREQYGSVLLADGDLVELVSLAGGG